MIKFVFYTDKLIPTKFKGFAFGPFVLIRPSQRDNRGLLEHELTHVRQFWDNPLLFGLRYKFSKKRRLAYEVEAYRKQLEFNPGREWTYSGFLADKYGLSISVDAAHQLLTA